MSYHMDSSLCTLCQVQADCYNLQQRMMTAVAYQGLIADYQSLPELSFSAQFGPELDTVEDHLVAGREMLSIHGVLSHILQQQPR
mmetsp:Transcript_47140/g.112202  ORF Transcript_47140/g.112202 Transcript_47140/m.112202 type:complete len:85 (-) Transcript_47140:179-433(-)